MGNPADKPPESIELHRKQSGRIGPIALAIVTVSDSRTMETDKNGEYLHEQVKRLGHRIVDYRVIPDEPAVVERTLEEIAGSDAQLILFNGGTGISPRDTTIDVIERMLEKEMRGFGEIFRMLSFQEVGTAAMITRATAGVFRGKMVVCTPGSPAAVRLAWEKLIEPELNHLVWEVRGR